mmetsp:Transcript_52576/g.128478  ORF Transcript_52576/g.128478 Transcript_52576/m.128478 type:complete len:391 (+) Transcript_52576:72-1244(+)
MSKTNVPGGGGGIHKIKVQFAASAGASAVSAIILTPLDVVKVRMQTDKGDDVARRAVKGVCSFFPKYNGGGRMCLGLPLTEQLCYLCGKELFPAGVSRSDVAQWKMRPLSTTSSLCHVECGAPKKGSNKLLHVVRDIVRYEGVGALWRGTGPSLIMAVPQVGIYLTTYDQVKDMLLEKKYNLISASLIAGTGARIAAATITSPLELVRTRLQAEGGMRGHAVHAECERAARRATGWLAIASKAVSEPMGVRTLWQGLGPTLWRDVPFSAIYWVIAERTRDSILKRGGEPSVLGTEPMSNTLRANVIAGVVGGTVASLVTHPFDVIKTKSQLEAAQRSDDYPKSTFAIGRKMVKERGLGALWRGMVPRLLKVAPSCGIVLTSYEVLKRVVA